MIIILATSLLAIFLKPQYTGVEIAYISKTSPAKNILEQGDIIYSVNGEVVRNVDDWLRLTKNISGKVNIVAYKGRVKNSYELYVNETIGIDVMNVERTNINFGLDIRGGTRILMKPKGNVSSDVIEQIIGTLETRANIFGLREIKFYPIKTITGENFIQIEAAGIGRDVVENLLSQKGNFVAKITKPVFLKDGKGIFILGENRYDVKVLNESSGKIAVSNITLELNDSFVLDGIKFEYINKSGDELIFLGTAYEGKDIELVYSDPQHSAVIPRRGYYQFYFVVLVSREGAERFAKITAGIPQQMDLMSGEYYLKDSKIQLYIDQQLMSELRIAASLGGKVYTTPQIEGSRERMEDAVKEKLRLQTILRSGALPVSLEIVSIGIISPSLGEGFITSAINAALLAALVVVVIVFIKYRNIKVVLPMIFTGLAEIVIILGIAAKNDSGVWLFSMLLCIAFLLYNWVKKEEIDINSWLAVILIPIMGAAFPGSWTIDLAAIGGIIAAIGTGMDNMIVIADETIHGSTKKEIIYGLKDKIKRAFFIIFGAAFTTIAAMFPLMFVGVGLVRGFAITTIVGILVGVLITRPAYARIIEIAAKK